MNYNDYITRDKSICNGVPVLKGTRVPLKTLLDNIADDVSDQEILESYPSLRKEHIRAAILFAASAAKDDIPLPCVSALS